MDNRPALRWYYNPKLKKLSQKNRNKPTPAEDLLWQKVLRKEQLWYKFVRQKPLDHFILDFYCSKLKLCIEVDGWYHEDQNQKEYDELRSEIINTFKIQVIRFSNEDIMTDIDRIKIFLKRYIESLK